MKSKKKGWLLLFIVYLLLVFSFLLLIFPMVKGKIIGYTIQQMETTETRTADNKNEASNDYRLIAPPTLKEVMSIDPENKTSTGFVYSPDLQMSVRIMSHLSQENLLIGAGVIEPSRIVGEDNYILLGHHFYDESLLFGPLLRSKIGQLLYVVQDNQAYTFKITQKTQIHETDLSVLTETEKPQLTLITCDKPSYTEQRIAVKAEFLSTLSETKTADVKKVMQQTLSQNNSWWDYFGPVVIITGCFILFLVGIWRKLVSIFVRK